MMDHTAVEARIGRAVPSGLEARGGGGGWGAGMGWEVRGEGGGWRSGGRGWGGGAVSVSPGEQTALCLSGYLEAGAWDGLGPRFVLFVKTSVKNFYNLKMRKKILLEKVGKE